MNGQRFFDNIKDVYRRIAHAAMRAGRGPEDVRLVAVTKGVRPEYVVSAIYSGLREFGENRIQEGEKKIGHCAEQVGDARLIWHFIGALQKNKVKKAVQLFDLIHSVDSVELAELIDLHAGAIGKKQNVLLEVKLSEEETKHGVERKAFEGLLRRSAGLSNIKVKGLMTIPPYFEDPEGARPYFRDLRLLRDEADSKGFSLPELSMGMSGDFEVAIAEGATIVRVGTAIFGPREAKA